MHMSNSDSFSHCVNMKTRFSAVKVDVLYALKRECWKTLSCCSNMLLWQWWDWTKTVTCGPVYQTMRWNDEMKKTRASWEGKKTKKQKWGDTCGMSGLSFNCGCKLWMFSHQNTFLKLQSWLKWQTTYNHIFWIGMSLWIIGLVWVKLVQPHNQWNFLRW